MTLCTSSNYDMLPVFANNLSLDLQWQITVKCSLSRSMSLTRRTWSKNSFAKWNCICEISVLLDFLQLARIATASVTPDVAGNEIPHGHCSPHRILTNSCYAGAWGSQPYHHLWADCLDNVGSLTSHNPIGLHGLLRGQLYFYLSYSV
jgi:hypothetical protein